MKAGCHLKIWILFDSLVNCAEIADESNYVEMDLGPPKMVLLLIILPQLWTLPFLSPQALLMIEVVDVMERFTLFMPLDCSFKDG